MFDFCPFNAQNLQQGFFCDTLQSDQISFLVSLYVCLILMVFDLLRGSAIGAKSQNAHHF